MRILITAAPLMYREALALAIHQNRPDAEVMLGDLGSLDGEVEEFRPHLLVGNDTDGNGYKGFRNPAASERQGEMLGETHRRSGRITSYWLISKGDAKQAETLTVGVGGGRRALPVFSFPDEAEFFLSLGGFAEDGWRIVESTPGELFSALAEETPAGVEFVALDPLPEMMNCISGAAISLVSLSRQRFMHRLAREREYAGNEAPLAQ